MVRQCDRFAAISDANSLFSYLVPICFPDAGSVSSMCAPGNDDDSRRRGLPH